MSMRSRPVRSAQASRFFGLSWINSTASAAANSRTLPAIAGGSRLIRRIFRPRNLRIAPPLCLAARHAEARGRPRLPIVESGPEKHLEATNFRVEHRPGHGMREYVETPPRQNPLVPAARGPRSNRDRSGSEAARFWPVRFRDVLGRHCRREARRDVAADQNTVAGAATWPRGGKRPR